MVDLGEDHEWGHGFDRRVCEGCPHKEEGGLMDKCGICGCPLGNLDREEAPPTSCPRLDDHHDPDVEEGDGGLFESFFG